jgi:hypothetical protein
MKSDEAIGRAVYVSVPAIGVDMSAPRVDYDGEDVHVYSEPSFAYALWLGVGAILGAAAIAIVKFVKLGWHGG